MTESKHKGTRDKNKDSLILSNNYFQRKFVFLAIIISWFPCDPTSMLKKALVQGWIYAVEKTRLIKGRVIYLRTLQEGLSKLDILIANCFRNHTGSSDAMPSVKEFDKKQPRSYMLTEFTI